MIPKVLSVEIFINQWNNLVILKNFLGMTLMSKRKKKKHIIYYLTNFNTNMLMPTHYLYNDTGTCETGMMLRKFILMFGE